MAEPGTVLAIGPYSDADAAALATELGAAPLATVEALAEMGESARAAVRAVAFKGHHSFGEAQMSLLPSLGLIANYGVGYDAIDTEAAASRGVAVTNTPDVLNDDVADLAVALLLAQGREMRQAEAWARSGKWAEQGEYRLNRKMSGGKAGIVGLGRIGREVADRLAAFKMEIHYFSRQKKTTPDGWVFHPDPVSLAESVDYLFITLVGGTETQGFISAGVIEALGSRGVLVNVSRGSTVDEAALLDALERGHLGGAALDVFATEPQIDPRFLALDNVVLQPHQGSGTLETRAAMAKLQRDNIVAFLAGDALLTPV